MTDNGARLRDGEPGSASVLSVSLVAVILTLLVGMTVLAQTHQAAVKARGAADLAALAAASQLLGPPSELPIQSSGSGSSPCQAATVVAERNGAHVSSCRVMSTSVQVEISMAAPLGRTASGLARAGEPE